MSEQKKTEIVEIVNSIAEIDTENLECAKNYLAGFVAGLKAAKTQEPKPEPEPDEKEAGA